MTTSCPPHMTPPEAPPPSPYVFPADVSTANMSNVVLIERGFPQFQSYVNDKSFAIVYEPDSSLLELVALLRQKFTSVQRIAVVSHYNNEPKFLENEPLFTHSDLTPGVTSFSKNTQGIIDILKEFNVANIDFLACKTLTDPNWTAFYNVLQSQANGVVVGASIDDTGNLKYGGNWVMENTNEDVKLVYFSDFIANYASLLATFSVTYPFGVLNYSYTIGQTTAQLQSVGTLTGVVTIPSTATYNGTDYLTINGINTVFQHQTGITTVIILAQIESLPANCFLGCSNMTSVTFPETLSSPGSSCLKLCTKLTYFNFPAALTVIPPYFFGFTNVSVYTSDLIIPNRMTSIGSFAFYQLTGPTKLYVPPGCTMGNSAFWECRGLTQATIHSDVGRDVFALCTNLVSVTCGPGTTRLDSRAFVACYSLSYITFPNTLTHLDVCAFEYCTLMKNFQIPSSVTFFGENFDEQPNSANSVFEFWHDTSFPACLNPQSQIALPSSTIIKVSKKVQQMPNYLAMVARYPNVTFIGMSIVSYSAYTPTIPTSSGSTVQIAAISTANLTDTTLIGTTSTEQKQFTASSVRTLFTANTAQKQLVLPIGSVLPGFSASLTTPVSLFNASSSVTNNKVSVITKTDILDKSFYVLLEEGDAITMYTNKGTVAVSKTGSIFTLTPSTGSAVTKVAGDTYSFDGLSVMLGSVYGTLKSSSVNFVLSALNRQFQLATGTSIPSYTPTLTSDAVITLNTSVSASVMQNTFFYRTDKDITLDASFVYFYVDSSKWTDKNTVLNPKNGIVTTNMYVSNDGVGKDFLRDLAKQLFGTYLGADLFTNEDSVITDVNAKCDDVATYAVALVNSIDKTVGTSTLLKTDLSGAKYLDDNVSTSNISRELFNQLMTSAPTRFNDTKLQKYNASGEEDGYYKLPIFQGDTITFKMTISPSATQTTAVPTGPTALLSRSYTVVMNVGA